MALASAVLPVPPGRDVHEFLQEAGLSDGLPVVPPTARRVALMLAASPLPPDHVLGKCPPNYGTVTVERVAVNAVLAGCGAKHFRVVLAAVEAMLDPAFNLCVQLAAPTRFVHCCSLVGPHRLGSLHREGFFLLISWRG